MKLLIVTPEYLTTGGGIATFYRNLVGGLRAQGVTVDVLEGSAQALGDGSSAIHEGVRVSRLDRALVQRMRPNFNGLSALPGLSNHLAAAWAAAEQCRFGEGYDVVEVTDWGLLFVPFVLAGAAPVVVQCHASIGQIAMHDSIVGEGAQDALTQLLERSILACTNHVQTYSEANAAFWQRETGRTVDVIRPAFSVKPLPQGLTKDEALVVGRLQRWKGPHVLSEALLRLGAEAPVVNWVGRSVPWGESRRSTAEHLAHTYPTVFGHSLRHVPPATPDRVRQMQAQARFNIVPSTWDVFNFTAVEAMASGRPVVVSSGAGANEIIENGVTGFVFEEGNAKHLADVIQHCQSMDDDALTRIGEAGREAVALQLDPDQVAESRLTAYEAAARVPGQRRPSDWVSKIASPAALGGTEGTELDFLDAFPLRSIFRYMSGRIRMRAKGFIAERKASPWLGRK